MVLVINVLQLIRLLFGDAGTGLLAWLWPDAGKLDLNYLLTRETLAAKAESPIEERLGRHLLSQLRYRPDWLIQPQVQVGPYRADFVIHWTLTDGRTVLVDIECDGAEFYSSTEARERDRRRDEFFRSRGYRVLRYSGRQLYWFPGRVATDAIQRIESYCGAPGNRVRY